MDGAESTEAIYGSCVLWIIIWWIGTERTQGSRPFLSNYLFRVFIDLGFISEVRLLLVLSTIEVVDLDVVVVVQWGVCGHLLVLIIVEFGSLDGREGFACFAFWSWEG